MKRQLEPVRYVLIARNGSGRMVARLSTPRHLWELKGLHHSLFTQNAAAVSIDVISWPWTEGETLADQEPVATAKRSEELEGAIVWAKDRELKELEQELAKSRL